MKTTTSTNRDLALLGLGYLGGTAAIYLIDSAKVKNVANGIFGLAKGAYNSLTFKNLISASITSVGTAVAVERVIAPSIKRIIAACK